MLLESLFSILQPNFSQQMWRIFFHFKKPTIKYFLSFFTLLEKILFFVFLCGKINFSNKLMETSKQIQLYAFLKLNLLSAPVFFFKVPTYFSFCSLEFFDTRWNLLKMLNIRNQKAAEQSINAIKSWQLALVIDFWFGVWLSRIS